MKRTKRTPDSRPEPIDRFERRLRADVEAARRPVDPQRVRQWIAALDGETPVAPRRNRPPRRLVLAAALLLAFAAGFHLATRGPEPALPPPPIEVEASPWARAEEWKHAFDHAMSDERRRILIDAERVVQAVWSAVPRRLLGR